VAPHRSAAVRGLIGGGSSFRPGYVSLAHRGVLYLEDVAGMPTKARDAALQATADGSIDLEHDGEVRSVGSHALLVGAATPCRCGGGHRCRCTGRDKAAHMEWLKRELFGHFDLVVHVTRPTQEEIAAHVAISTATANAQVNDAAGVLADRVRDPRRDPRLSLIERVAFELAALDGTDEPTAEHRLEASAIASPCR
jgi:magnesium chelatase family protein